MNMSEDEVMRRVADLPPETAKEVVCALIGHSRIITTCFGYLHCARCKAEIGDMLGGASDAKANVIVGHDCPTCRENALALTWKDTLMAPDPFSKAEVA